MNVIVWELFIFYVLSMLQYLLGNLVEAHIKWILLEKYE